MRHLLVYTCACLLALASATTAARVEHTVGVARDARTGELRYYEHHQYLEGGEHRIRYFDPGMQLIAYKNLRYTSLPQHPAIEQADLVTGEQVAIDYVDPSTLRQEVIAESGDARSAFSLPLTEDTVVDAGFDAYVRSQWELLTTREGPQTVTFAVAGQNRLLPMRIVATGEREFAIAPRNWLLRQLVPEIQLRYDEQRRLDQYRGFTNVSLPADADSKVVIRFDHYSSDEILSSPRQDWLSEL